MSDSLIDGRKLLRTFNVIDDYNREVCIDVDLSLPCARVIRSLEQVIKWRGKLTVIRLDNGPEYTAQSLTDWANDKRITLPYIQPGKPIQNVYMERINRKVRHE